MDKPESFFIKRYFGVENASMISEGQLESFLSRDLGESVNLEYKPRSFLVQNDDSVIKFQHRHDVRGFRDLAKTVSGFANAAGGLLVLGVKQKPENVNGVTIKISPGDLSPIPLTVTPEMIETQLLNLIQYPIEGVTILPVRSQKTPNHFYFLIDVPQSVRAPHRVAELFYFQRHNFSTLEMEHYQIADLFGKRFAPDLKVTLESPQPDQTIEGLTRFSVTLVNHGRAVAKHATCVLTLAKGSAKFSHCGSIWHLLKDSQSVQWTHNLGVVYPSAPTELGKIGIFGALDNVEIHGSLFAEDMAPHNFVMNFEKTA